MLIVLISLITASITFVSIYYYFGIIGAVIPSIFVFALSYWLIYKKISNLLEKNMEIVQKSLQKGEYDASIILLKGIQAQYSKWQFFTKKILNSQIGSIYYVQKKFKQSKPFLINGFEKSWTSMGMLGVLYYNNKDFKSMEDIFKKATKYSPKQGLLWSIWAYCQWKTGDSKSAINTLSFGKKKIGDIDQILNNNLLNLQNSKKMKMKGYGEQWYQMHLETHPYSKGAHGGIKRQIKYKK